MAIHPFKKLDMDKILQQFNHNNDTVGPKRRLVVEASPSETECSTRFIWPFPNSQEGAEELLKIIVATMLMSRGLSAIESLAIEDDPHTERRARIIEAIRTSGGERTTPAPLGEWRCDMCLLSRDAKEYSGGVWTKIDGKRDEHVDICEECSEQYSEKL